MHATEVSQLFGALAALSEASFYDLRSIAVFQSVPGVTATDAGDGFKYPPTARVPLKVPAGVSN